jgi:integrase
MVLPTVEPVKTVQRRMGHSSAAVKLDVYTHLWPNSEGKTRAAMDPYLRIPADYVRTRDT